MLLEYRNHQYEIDGSWNDANEVLSMWFPLASITDDQWREREDALRAYVGHHLRENATISSLELLRTESPTTAPLSPPEGRLAVLQAHYTPRAIQDIRRMAGCAYLAFGISPPPSELMLSQDIQQHALSAGGRGIELTFHGYLLFRSAADRAQSATIG